MLSRVWNKVKHEAQHYWQGSKLLAKEVRISARLQRKILQGETLTRRERRQVCSSYLNSSSTDYDV
jgi:LETM1 and EF-hand domain-containing protein 1